MTPARTHRPSFFWRDMTQHRFTQMSNLLSFYRNLRSVLHFIFLFLTFYGTNCCLRKEAYGQSASATPVRVGVSTTLTGEVASLGIDARNALNFANEYFANNRFEFVIEDDKCSGKDAVSVAQKLINVSKVKYVLGLTCNQSLLSAGPLYQRAGIVTFAASATTGDVKGLGNKLFRIFPSDQFAAKAIFDYIALHHKKIGILTEQNEYPELMERSFLNFNKALSAPLSIEVVQVAMGETDVRSALTKLRGTGVEALFLNSGGEPGFIRAVQQLNQLGFKPAIYGAYIPGSKTTIDALGKDLDGVIYSDTQSLDETLSPEGVKTLAEFEKRFGTPVSLPLTVPVTIETVRILGLALDSGKPVDQFLRDTKFTKTIVGDYSFDEDGAVQGLGFRLFTVKNGAVEKLSLP